MDGMNQADGMNRRVWTFISTFINTCKPVKQMRLKFNYFKYMRAYRRRNFVPVIL